jgi:Uma2 family endonuclease
MMVVIPVARPEDLERRKKLGHDIWDEMWDGVLHMPPMPNFDHQDLEGSMEGYLRRRWARPNKAKVAHQINLAPPGGWPTNFRIPDLILLTPPRFRIMRGDYFEGAPDVVVEIRSPDDESYDKLPFYAALGVPEVWFVDRDTKEPEIYLLRRGKYRKQRAGAGGWVRSAGTGVEMRATKTGKLAMRMNGKEGTKEELPED